MNKAVLIVFVFLNGLSSYAQDYNYIHYDTKDGLAASNVYDMCQDKDGYIWFATEFGVSRFDGKRFKTFTTADGLNDNEVLKIAADSKGRVWMTPFDNNVCYYWKNQVFSAKNDSLLNFEGRLDGTIFSFWEISAGGVIIKNLNHFFFYSGTERLQYLPLGKILQENGLQGTVSSIGILRMGKKNNIAMLSADSIFYFDFKGNLIQRNMFPELPWKDRTMLTTSDSSFFVYVEQRPSVKPIAYEQINIAGKILFYCATTNGAYTINTQGDYSRNIYLADKTVTRCLKDTEGNLWFATLGHGVYKLPSESMLTCKTGKDVLSIDRYGADILAGLGNGDFIKIKQTGTQEIFPFKKRPDMPIGQRLYCMKQHSSGAVFLGYDCYLAKYQHGKLTYSLINPVKSIEVVDEQYIAVATNQYTFKLRVSDMQIVDTLFRERAAKVVFHQDNYYFGTLSGLVQVDKNGRLTRYGDKIPICRERITDIAKVPGSALWVATGKAGVFRYADNTVTANINTMSGLSSNICRSLFYHNGFLWVGTNKGLNKVRLADNKVVAQYSVSDGLPADIINAIYADDTALWIGTPAGLTNFKEKDITSSSVCNLVMEAVKISGTITDSTGSRNLPWQQNNISFEYTAISFKSAGDIVYKYRLQGLNDEWQETRLTTLAYPSLPSGEYELELYAINKFGKQSNTLTHKFSIAAPFWRTGWFRTLLVLCGLALFWFILNQRFKAQQQRAAEKNGISRRMAQLEQTALRAQMNPHFIFNCLSSIQHFALQNDIEKTNEYISRFGSLIRQTMDNSGKTNISVAGEVKYLETYLLLEQMRFPEKFNWHIYVEPGIQTDYVFIPSMILQPFVENAIRHGIRYKETNDGLITVHITQQDQKLVCCVEDNGVGRAKAREYQGHNMIEYQSKGISLSVSRLEMLGADSVAKVETEITDLNDPNGNPCGTKVCIRFPQEIIEKLY